MFDSALYFDVLHRNVQTTTLLIWLWRREKVVSQSTSMHSILQNCLYHACFLDEVIAAFLLGPFCSYLETKILAPFVWSKHSFKQILAIDLSSIMFIPYVSSSSKRLLLHVRPQLFVSR